LLVYSLHLESLGDDQRRSNQLKDVLADQSAQPGLDVVIAGDFNNSATFQAFPFAGFESAGFVDALGNGPRQTAVDTLHPIDWLFARGSTSVSGRVARVEHVSDHYPLVATISW
jgi:endonuclease/exonuclease/phosphatase family metal-dependent hydrolase